MTRLANGTRERPQLSVRIATTGTLEIVAVPIEPTQATVQLQGVVDFATAVFVTQTLDEQLEQGHRFVRLDLSRLTFLDCAGLGALVSAHFRFLSTGGALVLTGVGGRAARLLQLTHLDQALLIADGPGEPPRARHLTSVPDTGTR